MRAEGWEWVNADIREDVGADCICDLTGPWPWDENTFDWVYADNVLEHFESHQAIHVLNEIGRVLKSGGRATIIVPHAMSQGAYQDPTHKSFWVPRSALYWSSKYTPFGGPAVGITAELVMSQQPEVYGDPATEQFIRFECYKDKL
jgi:ubiquinone/menaquinone biosynthesis C-methylase UbiE